MKNQEIERQIRQGRKTSPEGVLSGHAGDSGEPVTNSGDDQAPFSKVPPFVTPPEAYWEDAVLTAAITGLVGALIDVEKWRLLTVYIDYTANVATPAAMTLVPEAAAALATDPVPIGVVNSTITPAANGVGVRTIYSNQLITPLVTRLQTTLVFDVTTYNTFRFRAAELAAQAFGTVSLSYVLSM